MELLEDLNWRYATKRMTGEKIPSEKLDRILEAIRLSPSSIGLQPYNILVVEDRELKQQIYPVANRQAQILESSHLLVFAAWDNLNAQRIDEFLRNTANIRNVELETLNGMRSKLEALSARPAETNFAWAARQVYIALGTGLVAAAHEKIDASPMEGFNNDALDELLGLPQRGLRSVALLALGFRHASEDWNLSLKKVRWPREALFISPS